MEKDMLILGIWIGIAISQSYSLIDMWWQERKRRKQREVMCNGDK